MAEKVEAEIVNTDTEFKWRLKKGSEVSEWSSHYQGLLVHKFENGETWCVATQYWDGVLPIETPFQIIIP